MLRLDLQFGHDLLEPAYRCGIVGLIHRHVVAVWQFAPPRATFSQLRRPRLRSLAQPSGVDPEEHTSAGNVLACFTGMAFYLTDDYGQVVVLEQPGGSTRLPLAIIRRLFDRGFTEARFNMCTFGSPFRKSTS